MNIAQFAHNISTKLVTNGFEPNPYDPCVFNKINRDGLQITVALYVDDLLVTCEDERELDAFAAFLRASYSGDITEHRGDIAEYLAMTFDFRTRGEVRVTMKKLIDDIIAGCGVTAERSTPATDELFNVREDAVQLDQIQKDYFRTYVAKLLYVAKRVRPELIALSDCASQAIWVANFIHAQGYDVGPVVLHQDSTASR